MQPKKGGFMDTGNGNFKLFDDENQTNLLKIFYRNLGGTFRVGEEVELKGSRFRVKKITPKELRLKLLPRRTEWPK